MQLRIARHTDRLEEVVRFYRDGIGLWEVGRFHDHAGYDGVFLAVDGAGAHLEFTTGGRAAAHHPHPESLVVLYLGDDATVRAAKARLGAEPVAAANPYWNEHGVTVEDPDGFRVVLVPEDWEVRVRPLRIPIQSARGVEISWHRSNRRELWGLFALAEESPAVIGELIGQGRLLVATLDGEIVGCLQLLDPDARGEIELAILAVAAEHQGRGIGTALVERAIAEARDDGLRTMRVGTSSADISNLRFYQRRGFRMLAIERDAFTPADGYPNDLMVDGLPLRDRVWLSLALSELR